MLEQRSITGWRRKRGGWRRAPHYRGMLFPAAGVLGLVSVVGLLLVRLASLVDNLPYGSAVAFFVMVGLVAAILVAIRLLMHD